jgi:hypothetical protein
MAHATLVNINHGHKGEWSQITRLYFKLKAMGYLTLMYIDFVNEMKTFAKPSITTTIQLP